MGLLTGLWERGVNRNRSSAAGPPVYHENPAYEAPHLGGLDIYSPLVRRELDGTTDGSTPLLPQPELGGIGGANLGFGNNLGVLNLLPYSHQQQALAPPPVPNGDMSSLGAYSQQALGLAGVPQAIQQHQNNPVRPPAGQPIQQPNPGGAVLDPNFVYYGGLPPFSGLQS